MSNEELVTTRLPKGVLRDLEEIGAIEHADRDTTLRKLVTGAIAEWKISHYARQYGEGKISLAKAAEQAGVSLWEMIAYVRDRKIPAQYDLQDLEEDLQDIYRRLQ